MPHGQAVQSLPVELPPGHEAIHQRHEPRVVGGLNQVDQFMRDDVFQALFRLLGEFRVETNRARTRVTASPLSLHLLYKHAFHAHAEDRCPFDSSLGGAGRYRPLPGGYLLD